jgi:hypothetical protein
MDLDEWSRWQKHLPEILTWLKSPPDVPDRTACLEAVEMQAFAMPPKQMDRFLAVLSGWTFHKLPDKELELVLRILLEFWNGRHPDLSLGETGRRLLRAAEKKSGVSTGYLQPFREFVLAETE